MNKLAFFSDYMEGCHPNILKRLSETNFEQEQGYGFDKFSLSAREKIRLACKSPDADVYFLSGGTQTNSTIICALLKSYQGVISADSGHINVHEAGAIETNGHKVIALKNINGKIAAKQIEKVLDDYENDLTKDHMVMPHMVYITQPSEYGTLYSLNELTEISKLCKSKDIPLYLDGARLAYALSAKENDVTLEDIAKLCDIFYIGGTKCGALLGEAVVIPKKDMIPHLFTIIKQHGALLAKGRILGIQFDELFTNGLYEKIGETAITSANRIKEALKEKGFELYFENPTNQVLCIMENSKLEKLGKLVEYDFFEKYDDNCTVIRFATSWATKKEDVDKLVEVIKSF